MNRGFIIPAQNSSSVDYIQCAEVLAQSIKNCMPNEMVALLTDKKIKSQHFDYVITYPWGDFCAGDTWKLANDWQVYSASPFQHTIKLEADLYLPRRIDHWWGTLQERDLVISSGVRTYTGELSKNRNYRKIFDQNCLPDVYNAITYFKKSPHAQAFFETVKDIFLNWPQYRDILRCNDSEVATTDVVYAIAAMVHGVSDCTLPNPGYMAMVHMKQAIIGTKTSDWTRELLYEILPDTLRIGTIPQLWPVHYHVKTFSEVLRGELLEFDGRNAV